MAPPSPLKPKQQEREFSETDFLEAQDAEREIEEEQLLQDAQEAEDFATRPGTSDNPARAVERSERPMTPEEMAVTNPPWTPPKSPFAKYTDDPELQMELEQASRGGLTSAVRGFNDFVTRGHSDEILGYIGSKFPRLTMPIAEAIDPRIPTPQRSYEEVRNEMREGMKASEEEAPLPYYLGGIASVIASRNLPTAQGRWGNMAMGGAEGAMSALGNSEANLTTPSEEDLLRASIETGAGAGLGAIVGGAAPPLAQALARRIPGAASRFRAWLEKQAEQRAVKAVTGPNLKAITNMVDKGTLQTVGRDLLDNDIVTAGRNVEQMREAAEALQQRAGQDVGESLRALDERIPPGFELMPRELAGQAFEEVVKPRQSSTAGMQDVAARMNREVRAILDKGARTVVGDDGVERLVFDRPMSMVDANAFKTDLDPFINWGTPEPKPVQEALRQFRGMLNEQIELKGAQAAGVSPSASQRFMDFIGAKQLYGSMADVAVPGLKQQSRELANRLVSPSDTATGLGGMVLGAFSSGGDISTSALIGGGALLANKLMRERGPQATASALNQLSLPGGPVDRFSRVAAERISGPIQDALTSGVAPGLGRAIAGSEAAQGAVDFSQGPEARSQTPTGKALYNALQANPQAFGRYASRLANAAENGEAALALQDYLLGRSDPEYAELRKRALGIQE